MIGEAMSCGAVVVTTDAPPMNELVTLDRGVLIRVARSEPMRGSRRNYIDVADVEAKLNQVFAMSPERRAELSRNARAWYEAQDQRFQKALRAFLAQLPTEAQRMRRAYAAPDAELPAWLFVGFVYQQAVVEGGFGPAAIFGTGALGRRRSHPRCADLLEWHPFFQKDRGPEPLSLRPRRALDARRSTDHGGGTFVLYRRASASALVRIKVNLCGRKRN